MSFEESGFLDSSEWPNLIVNTLQVGEKMFAVLEELCRYSWKYQSEISVPVDDKIEQMRVAAYAKVVSTAQGACILLRLGMSRQGEALTRVAWESTFTLGALTKDRSIIFAIKNKFYNQENVMIQRALDTEKFIEHCPEQIERMKSKIKQNNEASKENIAVAKSKGIKTGKGSAYDLAKHCGLDYEYATLYTQLSNAVHSNIRDLDSHIVVDDDGNPLNFTNHPDPIRSTHVASMLASAVLTSLRCVLPENFENDLKLELFRTKIDEASIF